jgi:4-diphosphocytidyl-2-C-methyl-D-erythritol kinase
MICFPNAKINLGLQVISKRTDGYHNIETIFYPIGMRDALEIIPSDVGQPYRFFVSGILVDSHPEDNLVVKALHLIKSQKQIPDIDIYLLKKIPFGAGLGGGSADGAFMLTLLNKTFALGYTHEQLLAFARQLGADCSFFVNNRSALATGVGDQIEQIDLDLSHYRIVVVKPPFGVSTREAYAMVEPHVPEISLREVAKQPVSEWKRLLKNDFEPPILDKYPAIGAIKQKLYDIGAIYASMSGSGSSVYALFERSVPVKPNFGDCFVWIEE